MVWAMFNIHPHGFQKQQTCQAYRQADHFVAHTGHRDASWKKNWELEFYKMELGLQGCGRFWLWDATFPTNLDDLSAFDLHESDQEPHHKPTTWANTEIAAAPLETCANIQNQFFQ